MFKTSTIVLGIGALAGCIVCGFVFMASAKHVPAAEPAQRNVRHALKPVEGDLHEFMEHFFEPTFERLRRSIASRPGSDADWKHIAADALILAEGGNLLLTRSPDDEGKSWSSHATGLRTFGTFVYRAAREKDYTTAMFNYRHMVDQCNDCHREFAAGEPHLEP